MKARTTSVLAVPVLMLALGGCDVDVEREARLPEVDLDIKGGQLPKYDVDMADVDVETETKTIEIEVPTGIDVDFPEDPGETGDGAPPREDD